MTKEREALRMALEALKEAHYVAKQYQDLTKRAQAITAVNEALAQPEQPAECPNLKNCQGMCFVCEYWNSETGEMEYPMQPDKPEQEPDCRATGVCVRSGLYVARQDHIPDAGKLVTKEASLLEQEPAVFYRCKGCSHAYEGSPPSSCDCMEKAGFDRVEYFTAPQEREWVGLNDEGKSPDKAPCSYSNAEASAWASGAEYSEAKLKELNHDN
jgi:hypothetical protein